MHSLDGRYILQTPCDKMWRAHEQLFVALDDLGDTNVDVFFGVICVHIQFWEAQRCMLGLCLVCLTDPVPHDRQRAHNYKCFGATAGRVFFCRCRDKDCYYGGDGKRSDHFSSDGEGGHSASTARHTYEIMGIESRALMFISRMLKRFSTGKRLTRDNMHSVETSLAIFLHKFFLFEEFRKFVFHVMW